MRKLTIALAIAIAFAAAINIRAAAADSSAGPPLRLAVRPSVAAAIPFKGDGKFHAAYELYLTNLDHRKLRLTAMRVFAANPDASAGASLLAISQASLDSIFVPASETAPGSHPAVLAPNEAGILYIFLTFDSAAQIPAAVLNRVDVAVADDPATTLTIQSVRVAIGPEKPIVLSPPLEGANWWTPNGPGNDTIHRRTVVVLDGAARLPERFAVDWIKLGDNGSFKGPEKDNRSYFAYGTRVFAAADGRALTVHDGIRENVPHSPTMAVPITLDTIAGNSVVEDLGGGRYALYAHLQPGSVKVKAGDQIKRGQMLGLLGNSGNSSEPHLHFQVCDGPEPLSCNGMPFILDSWTRYDHHLRGPANPADDAWGALTVGAPHHVADEAFMNDDLGAFASPPAASSGSHAP
ncbi:MAG TPA: M23 family metallopeptidase [Candidatus Binataceae bacterium]|nr:M23 family metallopeptidase [Candidatus Binataceae bacterium]